MPAIHTKRTVNHSAENMFRLVGDVERYPEFVPLCRGLDVIRRDPADVGEDLKATMHVGHNSFSGSFTTLVRIDRVQRKIVVTYLEGPFEHLENVWQFHELSPQTSEVDFYIAYEFRSKLLGLVAGPMFDTAFRQFADAFEARADQIYGVSASS